MFETVTGTPDPEARRRHAASVGLTTALLAGLFGFQLGLAAFLVTEVAAPEVDIGELVMVETTEAPEPESAPAPPPPPRGGGTSSEEAAEAPEAPEEVPPLDPEPEPEVKASSGPIGPGTADGDPDGQLGGVQGGQPNGVPGGTGEGPGDGPRAFHQSELRRTKVVDPVYPKAARELGLAKVSCRVHVFIDEGGTPFDVRVEDCPTPFHDETRRAMLRSRWAPPRVDGERVRARTVMVVHYNLR